MRLALPAVLLLASSCACLAADLRTVRPGVMCASPEALARLTRHDGSSRAAGPDATPEDLAAKHQGGCVDLLQGDRVSVLQARHNTSVVRFAGRFGAAAGIYLIANIDFAAADAAPASPDAAASVPPSPAMPANRPAMPASPPPAPSVTESSAAPRAAQDGRGLPSVWPEPRPDVPPPNAPPQRVAGLTPPFAQHQQTIAPPPRPPRSGADVAPPMISGTAPDVTGLKLGMSVAQAGQMLNPQFVIQQRNLSDPGRTATVAYSNHGLADGDGAYEAYLLEFVKGNLAYIGHIQVFAAGSEPIGSAVAADLNAKYGEHSSGARENPTADWSRDLDGGRLSAAQAKACLNLPSDRVPLRGLVNDANGVHYDVGLVPRAAPEAAEGSDVSRLCGRILHADAMADPKNSALVRKLSVVLFEGAPFFTLDAEREAAQKQKDANNARAAEVNQVHL